MRLGRCERSIRRVLPLVGVCANVCVVNICAVLLAGVTTMAHAAMQLDRTRVIVTQTGGSSTVQVKNTGQRPIMLQVWVEPGDHAVKDKAFAVTSPQAVTPFIVDPPVLYLDAEKGQALRVWLTDPPETLPQDRESQFWLNVLEVPGVELPDDGGAAESKNNRLELTILTQIKLFYRPGKLADYKRSEKDKLRFTLQQDENKQYWLNIHNPAPIHQSLDKLALYPENAKEAVKLDAPMIAPFADIRLKLVQLMASLHTARVRFSVLDDRGEAMNDEQSL